MPGRWAFVGFKLSYLGPVYLFYHCTGCGAMLYTPDIEATTNILEFFQVITPSEVGALLLQRLTYDVGNWQAMGIDGGYESPNTQLEDAMGRKHVGAPAGDLTCGICAPPGVLPVKDVRECILAVWAGSAA